MSKNGRAVVVEDAVEIRATPEAVFDYCTDTGREIEWNPRTRYVKKLTDGPIGLGTRFEGEWLKGDPMLTEYVAFDRPRAWRSIGRSRRLHATSEGRVAPTAEGTRLVLRMELRPSGALRLLLPLISRTMQKRESENLQRIKAVLESRSNVSDG